LPLALPLALHTLAALPCKAGFIAGYSTARIAAGCTSPTQPAAVEKLYSVLRVAAQDRSENAYRGASKRRVQIFHWLDDLLHRSSPPLDFLNTLATQLTKPKSNVLHNGLRRSLASARTTRCTPGYTTAYLAGYEQYKIEVHC
jgi:hypothetical protein